MVHLLCKLQNLLQAATLWKGIHCRSISWPHSSTLRRFMTTSTRHGASWQCCFHSLSLDSGCITTRASWSYNCSYLGNVKELITKITCGQIKPKAKKKKNPTNLNEARVLGFSHVQIEPSISARWSPTLSLDFWSLNRSFWRIIKRRWRHLVFSLVILVFGRHYFSPFE